MLGNSHLPREEGIIHVIVLHKCAGCNRVKNPAAKVNTSLAAKVNGNSYRLLHETRQY
jgi:hypothetical protein